MYEDYYDVACPLNEIKTKNDTKINWMNEVNEWKYEEWIERIKYEWICEWMMNEMDGWWTSKPKSLNDEQIQHK